MSNIKFPVTIGSLKIFEKQNDDISINVFGVEKPLLDVNKNIFSYDDKKHQERNLRDIYPIFISKEKDRRFVIDLLYLTLGDKKHYCLIKNFNAYLSHNHHKRYHCRNCITASYTTEML